MDAKLKKTWLEALRSGRFQQGRTYLNRKAGFDHTPHHCCLGVLCEVSEELTRRESYGVCYYQDSTGSSSGTTLPPGLFDRSKMLATEITHLIHMNDDEDKSFAQIADWIEANL